MIDIKILRNNPEIIQKTLHNKVTKWVDLDRVIELDVQRIALGQDLDALRMRRNDISSQMGQGKPEPHILSEAKEIKEKIQSLEPEFEKVEAEFYALYKKIPNIPTADTPIGLTEEENVMVKQWGKIREFNFPVKNHAEIGEIRGWIDKERAANVAGSRFAYLKWDLVKLQFDLIQWVMDSLSDSRVLTSIIDEHELNVSNKPFVPVLPPYMIKTAPYDAMSHEKIDTRSRVRISGYREVLSMFSVLCMRVRYSQSLRCQFAISDMQPVSVEKQVRMAKIWKVSSVYTNLTSSRWSHSLLLRLPMMSISSSQESRSGSCNNSRSHIKNCKSVHSTSVNRMQRDQISRHGSQDNHSIVKLIPLTIWLTISLVVSRLEFADQQVM